MKKIILSFAFLAGASLVFAQNKKTNVLFIVVDDLRPELGCYGNKMVKSPNIDRLATEGVVFNKAYCQQALCAPSRASMLTGLRPNSTKIFNLDVPVRQQLPNETTLPQLFKEADYTTVSIGKIYHHPEDDAANWSIMPKPAQPYGLYADPLSISRVETLKKEAESKGLTGIDYSRYIALNATESLDVPDAAYYDGFIADAATEQLKNMKDKPFFMAVGFIKPHLPFNCPKKYWDLYDPSKIKIPDTTATVNMPPYAHTDFSEMRRYKDINAKGPVADSIARRLIHGYYACISYMDAQVGKVLSTLKSLGLDKNTIVVFIGDHGWKLGEMGQWVKHSNFELDTRTPFIVKAPAIKPAKSMALVELVDIYPTLADACQLKKVSNREGTSLMPLLRQPNRAWKKAVFSQYPRNNKTYGKLMGHSVTDGRWRYTEWRREDGSIATQELYDHRKTRVAVKNVANEKAFGSIVKRMSGLLAAGWVKALP